MMMRRRSQKRSLAAAAAASAAAGGAAARSSLCARHVPQWSASCRLPWRHRLPLAQRAMRCGQRRAAEKIHARVGEEEGCWSVTATLVEYGVRCAIQLCANSPQPQPPRRWLRTGNRELLPRAIISPTVQSEAATGGLCLCSRTWRIDEERGSRGVGSRMRPRQTACKRAHGHIARWYSARAPSTRRASPCGIWSSTVAHVKIAAMIPQSAPTSYSVLPLPATSAHRHRLKPSLFIPRGRCRRHGHR